MDHCDRVGHRYKLHGGWVESGHGLRVPGQRFRRRECVLGCLRRAVGHGVGDDGDGCGVHLCAQPAWDGRHQHRVDDPGRGDERIPGRRPPHPALRGARRREHPHPARRGRRDRGGHARRGRGQPRCQGGVGEAGERRGRGPCGWRRACDCASRWTATPSRTTTP